MKKFLATLILSFICYAADAAVKEPGKIDSVQCATGGLEAYREALNYLEKNPKKNTVVYLACDTNDYSNYNWNWRHGKNLEKLHKKSYKDCLKNAKKYGTGDCFLFSVNDKVVWELSEEKAKILNTLVAKIDEHDEEKFTSSDPPGKFVNYQDNDFIKYKEQKKLNYKNPKDKITGRNLYDQEDITDDYQMHAIYVLASDSKDKQYDVKGVIEKIVLQGNKLLKSKTKEKQFRLDLTKEGKLDVSFLRVSLTKKEINKHDDGTVYLAATAVRNGFYDPKKIYTIFYQDRYKREWGQLGDVILTTPSGNVEVQMGVKYLGTDRGTSEAYIPHVHEIFHALGFVQLCAPGAVVEKNSRWGKNDHLSYPGDIMSDGGGKNIDSKKKEYYGHSNKDCPMDLRKSVFLEPTEKDPQLPPRTNSCRVTRWTKEYNHQRALDCMAKLNF